MTGAGIVTTVSAWALFGLQHSFLAQPPAKDAARRVLGGWFADHAYRACYFATQCAVYPAFWHIVSGQESGRVLWEVPVSLYPVLYLLKLLGLALLLTSVLAVDVNEFAGVKPLLAGLRGRGPAPTQARLATGFPFNWVRHPMYLGILLSLATSVPVFTEQVVLNLSCLVAYLEVGIRFEERQLIARFGEHYLRYREAVPMYLPLRLPRRWAA